MRWFAVLPLLFLWVTSALCVIPLDDHPCWESTDQDYATGGAFGDLDHDGDLDLATGNGNDMQMERDKVYYNVGTRLETSASWSSGDLAYGCHIDLGDVNQDGWLDLAVANYLTPYRDDVYINLGGTLESTPSWQAADIDHSFALAWGDVDLDGDPDLAVACGERYSSEPEESKLYLNYDGLLEEYASWYSRIGFAYDVTWGDVDLDGDLDLFVAKDGEKNDLYLNIGGALEENPCWSSDESWGTIQAAWGDVDADGDLDVAVANNAQLSGVSNFQVYLNVDGMLETSAGWESQISRDYCSCVAWGDVDGDGDLDLAGGGWWEPVVVFENIDGTLETVPSWSWRPSSVYDLVCEQVVWGDVDGDGVCNVLGEVHSGDGLTQLFTLDHAPLHTVERVVADGVELGPDQFTVDLVLGTIVLAEPPIDQVAIDYTYSNDLDLVVTNWDQYEPSYQFENLVVPAIEVDAVPEEIIVPRGGELILDVTVTNRTSSPVSSTAWVDVILPNGKPYGKNPIVGPQPFSLSAGQSRQKHLRHKVPNNAPLGTYQYQVKVGERPSDIIDQSSFSFTVIQGSMAGDHGGVDGVWTTDDTEWSVTWIEMRR
jgi:hypothetical protein